MQPVIPAFPWKGEVQTLRESKVILGYKVSLRAASGTCTPVSKKILLINVFIQNERCKHKGK